MGAEPDPMVRFPAGLIPAVPCVPAQNSPSFNKRPRLRPDSRSGRRSKTKACNASLGFYDNTDLANTDMTADDIVFLLGYQEIGSFLRAFTVWTGSTVSEYRRQNH